MQNAGNFEFKELKKITSGQDGAIWNNYIFRFDHKGFCAVLDFNTKESVSYFYLDGLDKIIPHSNAVCFGPYKYSEDDEFPLLYTNVYNTYKNETNRREGICCVYRIKRNGIEFTTRLVQTIKIGFTDVKGLWISENVKDVRPYGNFIVDGKNKKLYAYTITRAF